MEEDRIRWRVHEGDYVFSPDRFGIDASVVEGDLANITYTALSTHKPNHARTLLASYSSGTGRESMKCVWG
jgi:hypothetical protein